MISDSLEKNLAQVENLADASKMQRFFHNPWRYAWSQIFRTLIYPYTKKGIIKEAQTFTGYPLSILLPSGLDIYLTGGKTHDSEIRLARYIINHYRLPHSEITKLQDSDSNRCHAFIDVGAHVGYFSLIASVLLEKKGQIFTFEAAKGTFDLLEKNLKSRNNIQTFHNAVTDIETDLTFFEFPVSHSEYNTLHNEQFKNEGWYQKFKPKKIIVKGITLDSIVQKFDLKNPLIKIDTEGAEAQVIKGGLETFKTQNPIIIMEFLTKNNEGHKEAYDILINLNYQPYTINKNGFLNPLADVNNYFATCGLESDNFVFLKRFIMEKSFISNLTH
jgi:FkbM family methyltransferase